MNHGLSDKTVATVSGILARYPQVERAFIYGSRAKGTYKPGSDIDLTLFGEGLDCGICSNIASDLDDSDIPYLVDLSVFALLKDQSLREHIERVGLVLYRRAETA